MAPLGADPDALRDLAGAMRTASARLGEVALGLERRTRATGWHGRDARRFEQEWRTRHRRALISLSQGCSRMAAELTRQADEQLRASSGTTGVPAAPDHRPSRIPALPRTEQHHLGGIEVTVGFFTALLRGEVVLQQLAGDRTRVVVTRGGAVGATAGAGASANVTVGDGGHATAPVDGTQADGRVRVGAIERRTWEVADDEVRRLLVQLAADEAVDLAAPGGGVPELPGRADAIGGTATAGVLERVAGAFDGAVEWLTGSDPGTDELVGRALRVPAPERVEALAEVELSGGVGIGGGTPAWLVPAGHLALSGTLRAGTATWQGGRSTIVEHTGSGSAALSGAMLRHVGVSSPIRGTEVLSTRLELVEGRDGGLDHALVKVTGSDGSVRTDTIVRVDLTGDTAAAASLAAAAERLSRGEAGAALDTLGHGVSGSVGDVEVMTSTAEIDTDSARASLGASAGLGVGISARGQVVEVDRRG